MTIAINELTAEELQTDVFSIAAELGSDDQCANDDGTQSNADYGDELDVGDDEGNAWLAMLNRNVNAICINGVMVGGR